MTLRSCRRRRGLSQRTLARRAGVAYKTVQLLEKGGHDCRWSTLAKLAKTLGLPGPEVLLPGRGKSGVLSLAETAERVGEEGEDSWKLWLFEFVDAFRRAGTPGLAEQAPGPGTSRRMLALAASTVEALCAERGLPIPWWCAGAPALPKPWFVSGTEVLKAMALVESPPAFRRRNIFVLGDFLSRA